MNYKEYQKTIPRDFPSDGCTLAPDGTWGHCCVIHDHARRNEKLTDAEADKLLLECMRAECKTPLLPYLYYFWVRVQSVSGMSPIGLAMITGLLSAVGLMLYFSTTGGAP